MLAIGATDNRGRQASFSESGPQLIACAAGQVNDTSDAQLIATDNVGPRGANTAPSPEGDYTTKGVQGTSYSAPQAAGVAALMLQVNANLGWRDVKEILIRTARKNDSNDSDWIANGAGFHFSHKYGAGYVDAAAAVALARTWTNLGVEISATQSSAASSAIPDNDLAGTNRTFPFANTPNLRVETVEVTVSVTHANRGQLGFVLISPAGTTTVLGDTRPADTNADLTNWTFSSPRHWGETSNGTWTVRAMDTVAGTTGALTGVSVSLFGTAATAVARPVITTQPVSVTVAAGSTAVFSAVETNSPTSYQWQRNGLNVPATTTGANGAILVLSGATAAQAGTYTLIASNSGGSITSTPATLTVATTSEITRLTNLSTLTDITEAVPSFTLGTVVNGFGTKPLVVRASGPTLGLPVAQGGIGVPGTIGDPKVDLLAGQTIVATNDNWQTPAYAGAPNASEVRTAMASVGAFPFVAPSGLDAAIYSANLPAQGTTGYTVQVSGVNGSRGVVIAEIYDATPGGTFTSSTPRLINVSVLKQVNAGSSITLGFNVGPPGGTTAKTILIRVIGPGLTPIIGSGAMSDPQLTLFNTSQVVIATNDNWGGDLALRAVTQSVAPGFVITDSSSKDAMLLVTLSPGGYTAEARGVGSSSGLVIVEAYEVP